MEVLVMGQRVPQVARFPLPIGIPQVTQGPLSPVTSRVWDGLEPPMGVTHANTNEGYFPPSILPLLLPHSVLISLACSPFRVCIVLLMTL